MEAQIEIPDDISQISAKSCFECHNVDAELESGKYGLLIDKLPYMKRRKIIVALNGISNTVADKNMPPKKFLKKLPDKALTKKEAKRLEEWAEDTADNLTE